MEVLEQLRKEAKIELMGLINWIAEYKPKMWKEILVDYAKYKGVKLKLKKSIKGGKIK